MGHIASILTFDGMFNAFHRYSLPYILPYTIKFDNESWWYSQFITWLQTFIYFRDSTIVTPLKLRNQGHISMYHKGVTFRTARLYITELKGQEDYACHLGVFNTIVRDAGF